MKTLRSFSYALALGFGMASPGFAATCVKPANANAMIAQVTADINGYRKAAGLGPLGKDSKLANTAQGHACDMAAQRKFSHVGSNGSDLVQRLKGVGYRFRSAVENVGAFQSTTPASNWWYNSRPHRANMLSPKINELGLGVAVGADKKLYWVMVGGATK